MALLPDHLIAPNPVKLWADFFQLLAVSCQAYVFSIELSKDATYYPGGQNSSVVPYHSLWTIWYSAIKKIPLETPKRKKEAIKVPDFISKRQNLLDEAKNFVFIYFYWVTLGVIFSTGTSTVTLFNLGYILGCFFFLWFGNSLFLRPMATALQLWDTLIFYNVSVIFVKISLQVVGCVYMSQLYKNFCWMLQLFGIACLKTGLDPKLIVKREILGECDVPHSEAGIFYDGLCFAFLLIQRRIFLSEYFKHVIAEYKSQRFFASRGAELIAKITLKDIKDAEEAEAQMLAQVRKKVEGVRVRNETDKKTLKEKVSSGDELSPTEASPNAPSISIQRVDTPKESTPPSPIMTDNGALISLNVQEEKKDPRESLKPSVDFAVDYSPKTTPKTGTRMSKSIPQQRGLPLNPLKPRTSSDEQQDDEWYTSTTPQKEKIFDEKIIEKEGGVKGLGPLQLLHFVFSKGSFREALRESRKIEATHEKLEKEMEQTFGKADHEAIRRAIFSQKQKKPKADYDEETFHDPYSSGREDTDAEARRKSTIPRAPLNVSAARRTVSEVTAPGVSFSIDSQTGEGHSGSSSPIKETMENLAAMVIEEELDEEEQETETRKKIRARMRASRLYQYYIFIKEWLRDLWRFNLMFCDAVIESTIQNLMILSRDYRYVAKILTTEKRLHKELADESDDERLLSAVQLERKRSFLKFQIENRKASTVVGIEDQDMQKLHNAIEAESTKEANIIDLLDNTEISEKESIIPKSDIQSEYKLIRLIRAFYYALMSKSEFLCYLMIVLNHMSTASMLSMPLPLMTLLWGTLTVPRPTKRFWITIITYTEVMVVAKTIFQFGFFPWNGQTSVDPMWPPRLLGIEKRDKYAAWDLALLMCVFFHRSILMANGLWEPQISEAEIMRKLERKRLKVESAATSRRPSIATLASELRSTSDLRHIAELGRERLKNRCVSSIFGAF
ncbi:unnamed protein product, partial [Mesorhabditis belari]|uniref:Piezo-type mechanosensitive ion channel component n=1 Tax=Mesorhabditis belari TaxID=2138241 RepID=A0AAF3EMF3_9BILA